MARTHVLNSLLVLLVLGMFTTQIQAKATNKTSYKISSGKLYLQVKQASTSSPEPFQVSYDSSLKSELKLSQSSKI